MYITQAFALQALHTLLSLLGFFLMGWVVLPWISGFTRLAKLSITVAAGYAFSLTATYLASSITESVSSLLLPIFLFLSFMGLISNVLYRPGFIKTMNVFFGELKTIRVKKTHTYFLFPFLAALAPVAIPLWKFARNGHFSPTFTQGNNDIAQFVLEAEAILRGGFQGIGFIANQDQFIFSRDNDFGAPNLLLWISRFTFSEPWTSVTPSLSLMGILLTVSISEAIQIRSKLSPIKAYGIGVIASSSAVPLYLHANIFLSQLIGMWIWANILLIISKILNDSKLASKRSLFVIIGLHFGASFFTYPHMTLICLGVYGLSLLLFKKSENHGRKKNTLGSIDFSIVQSITIPIVVLVFVCNIYLIPGINLFLYRASASNGWPMPNQISLANLFAFGDYSGSTQSLFVFVSAIIVLKLVLREVNVISAGKKLGANRTETLAWTLIPISLYLFLAIIYGPASYKAWKVLFSFAPILIAGAALSLVIGLRASSGRILWKFSPLLAILILVPMLRQSIPLVQNEDLYRNRVSSQDLYNLRFDLQKFNLMDVNIQLSPFFETMYAGAIIDTPVSHFAVPTYAPILVNEKTCTLIRTEDLPKLKMDKLKITKVNNTYSLMNSPSNCMTK